MNSPLFCPIRSAAADFAALFSNYHLIRTQLPTVFLLFPVLPACGRAVCAVARAASAAASTLGLAAPCAKREIRQKRHDCQQNVIAQAHQRSLAIVYTTNAAAHATEHCINTTPTVFTVEFSSRRIVATAAMQGV